MTVSLPLATQDRERRDRHELADRPGVLRDRFGRVHDYLRIAVTDRCNLRCVYCMPEEGVDFASHERLLGAEEILRVVGVAATLGVRKVRFTGGEPLLHRDIVELVRATKRTAGIESVHVTTNGLLLSRHATALRESGLDGLNISLDTLRPDRFLHCARRAGIERVLEGLDAAKELRFSSIKINVVAMRGFNDDELGDFVELTRESPITVRFLELMPFDAHQVWRTGRFLRAESLARRFRVRFPYCSVHRGSPTENLTYRVPGYAGRVAFIGSHSRTFCGDCSRLRLTADGQIRNCLYSGDELDLLGALRSGAGDDAVAVLLRQAIWDKQADGLLAQQRARRVAPRLERSSMTQIGG